MPNIYSVLWFLILLFGACDNFLFTLNLAWVKFIPLTIAVFITVREWKSSTIYLLLSFCLLFCLNLIFVNGQIFLALDYFKGILAVLVIPPVLGILCTRSLLSYEKVLNIILFCFVTSSLIKVLACLYQASLLPPNAILTFLLANYEGKGLWGNIYFISNGQQILNSIGYLILLRMLDIRKKLSPYHVFSLLLFLIASFLSGSIPFYFIDSVLIYLILSGLANSFKGALLRHFIKLAFLAFSTSILSSLVNMFNLAKQARLSQLGLGYDAVEFRLNQFVNISEMFLKSPFIGSGFQLNDSISASYNEIVLLDIASKLGIFALGLYFYNIHIVSTDYIKNISPRLFFCQITILLALSLVNPFLFSIIGALALYAIILLSKKTCHAFINTPSV